MLEPFRPYIVLLVVSVTSLMLPVQNSMAQMFDEENNTSLQENSISNISKVESKTNMSSPKGENNTITLNVAEIGDEEQYRWVNGLGAQNPTLNLTPNKDYIFRISNPTDEEHELIIDSTAGNGKTSEIAMSEEIKPQSENVVLNFKTNQIGELGYHCKYHPDMMNGTIIVTQ